MNKAVLENSMNNRRFERYAVEIPVFLHSEGFIEPRPFTDGRVFNLSVSGCKVECESKIKTGNSVGVVIHFSNLSRSVRIHRAVVVWSFDKDFGLEFVNIQKLEKVRLHPIISFLSNLQNDWMPIPIPPSG